MSSQGSDSEVDNLSVSQEESDDDSISDSGNGKAVCLVRFESSGDYDDEIKLSLNSQQLNKILDSCGDRRLCVISAVGPTCSGKSFLLNCIKEKLEAMESGSGRQRNVTYNGFPFKSGSAPVTKGIWLWNKPFVMDIEEEEAAVLLMDTEGISDEFSTPSEICAIIGISLLASSVTIVNLSGDFTRPPFDWLSTFTRKSVKGRKFQKLSFLIRDWTKAAMNRHGEKGGRKLMDNFISQNSSRCGTVSKTFNEMQCFLMPHVGEKALLKTFKGAASDLSKEFSNYMQTYLEQLLGDDKLPIKKLIDVEVTAKEFKHFFTEYVNYFNDPLKMEQGPSMEKIADIERETAGKIKLERGLKVYHDVVNKRRGKNVGGFLQDSEITSLHSQAKRKALQAFKSFALPQAIERKFETKFEQELANLLKKRKADNQAEKQAKIADNISQACEQLMAELQRNFPFESKYTFYDEDDLYDFIEESMRSVQSDFFGEFTEEDDDELEALQRELEEHLVPIADEFRNKNTENRDDATALADAAVDELSQDYMDQMQTLTKRIRKLDQDALETFHDIALKKIEKKFEKKVSGPEAFKQQYRDELMEKIDEELENKKLGLEATMAEALALIKDTASDYEKDLKEKSEDMDEEDLISYHEENSKAVIRKFSTKNPYPPETAKYDEVESKLKKRLREIYETVVEDGILKRRKQDDKLASAMEASFKAFKNHLEERSRDDFLQDEECKKTVKSAKQKCMHLFESKVLGLGAEDDRIAEEKTKLESKIKDFKASWEQENDEWRTTATTEAESLVEECVALYETKMNASMKNVSTTDDLHSEHEDAKEAAVNDFQEKCKTKNDSLVTACIHKIEETVEEMLAEIEENFVTMKKANEVGLMAAQYDAKSYYQENMDKMFDNNADGYFKDSELETMDRETRAKAMKKVVAEHSPTKQQQSRVEKTLQNLFDKYKQKNEMTKRSYSDKEVAIGIDLGTTYCCVAAYHMGKVQIVRNSVGTNITPSYVTLNADGTKVVGHAAKEQAFKNPEATIFDAKRMIGRRMDDGKLQNDMKFWPFEVNNVEGTPKIKVHGKHYRPEEISAMLLKHLKDEAADILGVTVTKAVITVPAYFTDGQRQATIDAAEIAGLEVLGILNEPTAAAVAYRLDWRAGAKPKTILVYDLGGGTFDVAIMKMTDTKLDVLTVNGDSHLGGEDFDKNLMLHCANEFKKETGIDLLQGKDSNVKVDSDAAKRRLKRLQLSCENAKKALSTAPTHGISVDEIVKGSDLAIDVRRKQFEEMNDDLFRRSISIVDDALKSVNLQKDDIDDVVLVGGSTRIKVLQTMLETHFQGKSLNKRINPDEAVAYGAAVQAAILNTSPGAKIFDFGVIQEVTPMSLGIAIASGEMSVIIVKNTKIPVTQQQDYRTFKNMQTSASIRIYQGEEDMAKDNKLLGTFVLNGIPPGPAGKECLDVTMNIDQNGILSVEAACRGTRARNRITVSEEKGRLSNEQKRQLRDENS